MRGSTATAQRPEGEDREEEEDARKSPAAKKDSNY